MPRCVGSLRSRPMAGCQIQSLPGCRFAAVLVLCIFTFASRAVAQTPPPLSPYETPAQGCDTVSTSDPATAPVGVPQYNYFPVPGASPSDSWLTMGCVDVVTASLF